MSFPEADTRFDATPEEAVAAIIRHRGPVVVDLDDTLLLGNSTSLFLEGARPRLVVYLLVKVLDLVRPGRRGGSGPDRDTWRIRMLLRLVPLSRWRWRRQVEAIARERLNWPLLAILAQTGGPLVISTRGFEPIVRPLIDRAGLGPVRIVAMDPGRDDDRDEAKLRLTEQALAPDGLGPALVVTDSLADHRLLEACATPLRVLWPHISPAEPFASTYVPGRYLAIKRPNANYVRKILKEDLALWILASVWFADNPAAHVVGLTILSISFWAVYEYGYMDNDLVADRYEHEPALSDVYHNRGLSIAPWKPLLFAVVTGAAGLLVLRLPDRPDPFDFLRWAAVLATTTLIFLAYNRVDKQTRVLLYPVLQLLRLGAFVALVPTNAIADAALIIMVLLRWVAYFVYRTRDRQWPNEDLSVIQLIVFVAASILLASQQQWSELVAPTALSLLAWNLLLARHGLPRAVAAAHRIDRPRNPTGGGSPGEDPGR